jgi:hypothetical protein
MAHDPLLTVAQLAAREGVPEWKVRKWVGGRIPGEPLPHYKAGGVRVRESEYERWLDRRRRG